MKQHHRRIEFRNPYRREGTGGSTGFNLLARYARDYLRPHIRPIALCVAMSCLAASSFFLNAYYGRVVVDKVLVVTPAAPVAALGRSAWETERGPEGHGPPAEGAIRPMERHQPARPPGAGVRLAGMFTLFISTVVTINTLVRLTRRTRFRVDHLLTSKLRSDLHQKVLALSLAYHKVQTPGRLLSRIMSDVETIQDQMMPMILTAAHSLTMVAAGMVILLASEWRMCAVLAFALPLYAWAYRHFRDRIVPLNREIRHTNACLWGYVTQKLDGLKAIQAYGRESLERLHFHRLSACFFRDSYLQYRLSGQLQCASTAIAGLATGTVFLLGAQQVLRGEMSIGKMMYVYGAAANMFAPVLQLTQLTVTAHNVLVVLRRVFDVLDEPVRIADPPDAVEFPRPLKRGIRLENVSFAYSGADNASTVLENVSLDIPVGSWLCIMGASGAGKTTLLCLLTRLYQATTGRILFDDIPIEKIRLMSLHRHIGFVPQEAQIFSGTVRDNICYGHPNAEPRQIMAAAKAAQLHDFIMRMPVQYETIIGEKGVSLSGGQRQRLSLARALLTDPEVLVLDDCTSALDAETERRIQETLAEIMRGKTAVIVSHRVSMAMRCHQICTLDKGRVAEIGTHENLKNAGGFYARLCARQTEA